MLSMLINLYIQISSLITTGLIYSAKVENEMPLVLKIFGLKIYHYRSFIIIQNFLLFGPISILKIVLPQNN